MSSNSSTSSSKAPNVRSLLKKLLAGLIVFLILSISIQYVVDTGIRKTEYRVYSEWNDMYNGNIDEDLIILGSSRATVHMSPEIIEEKTGYSTYNLGLDGYRWRMQYCRFRILIEHNPVPKQIVISLDSRSLEGRPDLLEYEQFVPYLDDPLMRECTEGYVGTFNWADYNIPLYRYYGLFRPTLIGFMEFLNLGHVGNEKIRGYNPQDREWNQDFESFKSELMEPMSIEPASASISDLEDILQYAKDNQIPVALVYSPEYFEIDSLFTNRREILDLYRDIANRYGATFLDYSDHEISYDLDMFYNSQHLKREGAERFSRMLAEDLVRPPGN